MADNSAKIAKMTRILAFIHIIIGFLLICFGIADRLVERYRNWVGGLYLGICTGAWMCITGGLGIPSSRERTGFCNPFAGLFMGFSIASALLGGLIIYLYSASLYKEYDLDYYFDYYSASMAIRAIILILGIVEFVIGIWAAICCCLITRYGCCATQQQGQQVVYTANPAGYVITQGPDGVPVAVPVQAGGGMVAVQTSGTQENQPPMVPVPMGGQPMNAQAAPTGGLFATGYPAQQEDKPPQYDELMTYL